jgi:hypothetical protein
MSWYDLRQLAYQEKQPVDLIYFHDMATSRRHTHDKCCPLLTVFRRHQQRIP